MRFGLDQVLARRQVDDEIDAVVAGGRGGRGAGGQAGDRDLGLRQHGIRRIAHDAGERRAVDLREGGGGTDQQQRPPSTVASLNES